MFYPWDIYNIGQRCSCIAVSVVFYLAASQNKWSSIQSAVGADGLSRVELRSEGCTVVLFAQSTAVAIFAGFDPSTGGMVEEDASQKKRSGLHWSASQDRTRRHSTDSPLSSAMVATIAFPFIIRAKSLHFVRLWQSEPARSMNTPALFK